MKKILFVAAVATTALLSACKPSSADVKLTESADTLAYALGALHSAPSEQLQQFLVSSGSDSAYIQEFLIGVKDAVKAGEDKKLMAYNMGIATGLNIQRSIKQINQTLYGNDESKSICAEAFLQGFKAQVDTALVLKKADGSQMTQMELDMMVRTIMQSIKDEQVAINKKAGEEFLQEVAKQEGVKTLNKGVLYKEIKAGDGETPAAEDKVTIAYEGRFIDGKVFDKNESARHIANGFVPGFNQAIQSMKVGAEWEVYLSSDQAYGDQGYSEIPGGATLIFKITLKSIEKAAPADAPTITPGAPNGPVKK